MKFKTWFKRHWDELLLFVGVAVGIIFILIGFKVL